MAESTLLAKFAANRSSEIFSRLVGQYVGLVYASARRQLSDAHLAEDVTQAVFILLSQKAGEITGERELPAWLLSSTRFMVANLRREIALRHMHERKAASMRTESTASVADSKTWSEVSPLLDEGLEKLSRSDRDAVLLRFFQSKSLRQVGETLGVSESAAEKRVARAIDRLRMFFASKGVNVASSALMMGLTQSLHIQAPAGLAATIARGPSTGSIASRLASSKARGILMSATQAKIAAGVVGGIIAIGGGVAAVQYISTNTTAATAPAPATQPDVVANSGEVPASQPGVNDWYELKSDEPIRIVRNAPADVRLAMWTQLNSTQASGRNGKFVAPAGPFAFNWNGGHPDSALAYSPGVQLPIGEVIKNLLQITTAFDASEIELPANLPEQAISIPGDVVYTNTLPIDKALAGLQSAMQKELKIPIKLAVAVVDRKVYVLRGQFSFSRIDFKEPGNAPRNNGKIVSPLIEIYGSDTFDPQDACGSAMTQVPMFADKLVGSWLARSVSSWIGDRQIVVEATGFPNTIGWREHVPKDGRPNAETIAHDPANVLKHFCEQTGLTCTQETRNVSRIIVTMDAAK